MERQSELRGKVPVGTSFLCGRAVLPCNIYLRSLDGKITICYLCAAVTRESDVGLGLSADCIHIACPLVCVQGCRFLKIVPDSASDSVPFSSYSLWYVSSKKINWSLIVCYMPFFCVWNLWVITKIFKLSFINSWKLVSCESVERYTLSCRLSNDLQSPGASFTLNL